MNVVRKMESVTPEEFEAMEKDERFNYELIDGVVMMSPRPTKRHQRISLKLAKTIDDCLNEIDCDVYQEIELDIDQNHIIPDLSIICDDNDKSSAKQYTAPLIVIEILSPATIQHDLIYKLNKYINLNIAEYWIIDPKIKMITIHDFAHHNAATYGIGEIIQSKARPEITITVADIFN